MTIRLGILGGGQLAQMMCEAAQALSPAQTIETLCLADAPDCPASRFSPVIEIDFDAPDFSEGGPLDRFVNQVDVITFEWENIPLNIVDWLSERCTVYPNRKALATAQDRLLEKQAMVNLGAPVPDFVAVDSQADLVQATEKLDLPLVVKTRREGYDGKGQYRLKAEKDIARAWEALGNKALIVEDFVSFEREVSLVAVKGTADDNIVFYPLVENQHESGILRLSLAPFDEPSLQQQAQAIATKLIAHLDYIGVLTIEFFVKDGQLLVNEIAPRVHNSGHWTIEGAQTSQFENHVRAVCGLPLGNTTAIGYSAMLNTIGEMPPRKQVQAIPNTHYHDYGKAPRPGRKLGHVTVQTSTADERDAALSQLTPLIKNVLSSE